MVQLKTVADASSRRGEIAIALHLYDWIIAALKSRNHSLPSQHEPNFQQKFYQVLLDTLITKAYLQVKSAATTGFCQTVSTIVETMRDAHLSDRQIPCVFHLNLLAVVVTSAFSPPLPSFTIAKCIARLRHAQGNPLERHDAAMLERCPDRNKIFTPDDIPITTSSFHSRKRAVQVGKPVKSPDHIKGWLDLQQLRNADKVTRERINKLQAERGWRITPFESYDAAQ